MELHVLFHSVHQLSRQIMKRNNTVLQKYGLYSAQWSVLYVLMQQGRLTQKELSEYLAVEAPPMTRTIQRLVKQGYVRQVPGEDKRMKFIELTELAQKEYPVWEKAVLEMNEQTIKGFSKEHQRQLQQLMAEWLSSLESQQGEEEKK
ncbi:MarR family winged helix-turn-helix transcriptional regulator [Bacillus badius]|uniref:Transcriptional regulator, MarR family n=1 Tax=Bacillus badius TaxID=1455 RepID=A0ABR5ARC9_BACBA|nr:MarR family transcriptional regulator [Bacillus badius]KIL72419.1 Transcriptional regulator, MarR family [Bacillus badius]KIL77314.1 Transcriptional regulator, MarR family [Bacillus badius]KZO01303.1 MarR family transcriptional regulator [Bacillus badius]KZR58111.1 MarR family transcriptional regulator [Bacillus badius]MED0665152.1 MarR family transcriptional regulator [Bacillus badius]